MRKRSIVEPPLQVRYRVCRSSGRRLCFRFGFAEAEIPRPADARVVVIFAS
jgi:hypothetical protein